MNPKVLIILPTYNESGNLARLVGDLRRENAETHLLVIDDNSPDGTGAIADELKRTVPGVDVVHRSGKLGLGSAHILGLDRGVEGGYDIVVTMDCDYTHDPKDVVKLLDALADNGCDMAAGSRYLHPEGVKDWPLWRQAITRTAHLCTTYLLGVPHDATSAFRAYRTSALRRVPYGMIRGDGYSFIFEMMFGCIRAGLSIAEVPMQMPIRQAGESKISRIEVVRAVVALGRLSSARILSQVGQLSGLRNKPVD